MTENILVPRRSFWRALCDRNPFYLLSAVCMLFGCIALTNSSSWSPIRLNRLIILTATLNFYEFLLIGLALFLIVKRGLRRDGTILLILEAFFLVDVTFLNSEIFSTSLRAGLLINSILFALAIVKVAAIFSGLGMSLKGGAFATAMIELLVLFAMPGVFKKLSIGSNGSMQAMAIYVAWWAIGCLPVIATMLMHNRHHLREPQRSAFLQSRGIVGLFVMLPVISIIAHVSTSGWVYGVHWYHANVSPLLLGLAIAIGAFDTHVSTLGKRMKAHFILPILALVASGEFPKALLFHVGPIWFSPLRCALIGAMLVYVCGFLLHRHILFAWAACMCFGIAGVGMSMRQILENLHVGAQVSYDWVKRLWPRTMTHWGVVSMAASFVLLVVGALVSLRRPVEVEHQINSG